MSEFILFFPLLVTTSIINRAWENEFKKVNLSINLIDF